MPRWRAADVVVERFGASEVLVARTGGAPGHLVSLDDARVLVACDSFDDDDVHAARIADDVELAASEVVAALGRLRALGLLMSDEEARATAIAVGRRAEVPPGIAAVGVLTCDRPRSVARLLDGLRRSIRLPLWICDDSRIDSHRAATRELASAARREGADVHLLGGAEKRRLAAALVAAGAEPALVELALFDPEGLGYTAGANRNAFRLVTEGHLSLLIDDDATTRVARPHNARGGIRFTSEDHGVELWFHDSVETALADRHFEEVDLVALHEQLLGRTLADCAARHGPAGLELDGASPALLARLIAGTGRVLITQCGYGGDAGISTNASFLALRGENRERLVARYTDVRDASALHRTTGQLLVTEAPYLMGLTTGLDGRHLLPPWMPFLRNSDGVLAALARTVHPDGGIGSLPHLVEHRPPEVRRFAHDAMIRGGVELRFSDLIRLILRDCAPLPHGPPEDTLDALGRHFVALGALPPVRFNEVVRALRWDDARRQANDLELSAAHDDAVARDAATALAELRSAMLDSRATTIVDCGDRAQRLLGRVGDLWRGWPAILDAARRVDVESITEGA
jgi:hypothetical protein